MCLRTNITNMTFVTEKAHSSFCFIKTMWLCFIVWKSLKQILYAKYYIIISSTKLKEMAAQAIFV